ncbi:MAG: sulfite exporter TauE/SafE family protein [Dehalococcoidia bacterium]
MSFQQLALIAAVGFAGSFYGVVSGGGGLLVIPGLIFVGMPAPAAVAASRLGILGLSVAGATRFRQAGLVHPAAGWRLLIVTAAGSFAGSLLLLRVDADLFQRGFGVVTILVAPLIIFGRRLRLERPGEAPSPRRRRFGYALAFPIGVYAGLFGASWATFFTYLMVAAFGRSFLEGAAMRAFVGIAVGAVTALTVGLGGILQWTPALTLFGAMMAGSYLGASFSLARGERYARHLVAVIAIIAGVKLILP